MSVNTVTLTPGLAPQQGAGVPAVSSAPSPDAPVVASGDRADIGCHAGECHHDATPGQVGEVYDAKSLPEQYRALLNSAEGGRAHAYTPNSHSNVGAAALTKSGHVYPGCNVELTRIADHGEQVAIGKALAQGENPDDIIMMGTVLKPGALASSCGNCRQVLYDVNPAITGVWPDDQGNIHVQTLQEELPDAYHRTHPPMEMPQPPEGVTDGLLQEAYIARSHAFVNRSHYPVGAAVETADGKMYRGIELEASSFPLSAARLAIDNAISEGVDPANIVRIALVGSNDSKGELPNNLSFDTLEAMEKVIPKAIVEYPGPNGIAETSVDGLVQMVMHAGVHA